MAVLQLTPHEYVARFARREALPPGARLEGLCGRFIRGTRPEDFEILSEEPGKKLSWVCSSDMLGALLGKSPCEAMLSIGFRGEWMRKRLEDGTSHMLVVFPSGAGVALTADWANIFTLVERAYGAEVAAALAPFQQGVVERGCDEIDPGGAISFLADLPTAVKHANPMFMLPGRFLALGPARQLWHARAFLDHSVGCNTRFTGTGLSPDGAVEMMAVNRPLAEIPGLARLPLEVTPLAIEQALLAAQAGAGAGGAANEGASRSTTAPKGGGAKTAGILIPLHQAALAAAACAVLAAVAAKRL